MTGNGKVPVSCVVLTLNEEVNLPDLVRSLAKAEQVLIVDSGSVDRTVPIAKALGAQVLENPWRGYAEQRNWALDHCDVRWDWVFFIDADERVSPEGWAEIEDFLADPAGDRAANFRFSVRRFGRELKHGGIGSARVARLLHRRYCRFLERPVHEHAIVDGPVRRMTTRIIHDDHKPFAAWLDRHNRYSTLEAHARLDPPSAHLAGSPAMKQWIRTHLWPRLPARPLLYFLYLYVLRLGFLDGKAGLRVALYYGFQELSIQVKMEEFAEAKPATSADHLSGMEPT